MFLLDTNVISELRRAHKKDPRVHSCLSSIEPSQLFLSVITVLEIEASALRLERRDRHQSAILRTWIDNYILPQFRGRILPVDIAVARCCARLHVPNPRAERDALIAATALVHGLTVVTRNEVDFEPMGVLILNPWS